MIGHDGRYEVSDRGRVRALARRAAVRGGATRSVRSRIVTLGRHAQGYVVASLQHDNASRAFLVHRLVAAAFIGAIPRTAEVNHKDGDKANNSAGNLEIVTRQENIDHAVRIGLIDNKGERNAQAKLTGEQVQEIRSLYQAGGAGYKSLGKRFGVSWGTVRDIIKRRAWRHLAA